MTSVAAILGRLFCEKKPVMTNSPYRVLCVCLGNICRSPTAEVILQQHAQAAGLALEVDSAGTSNYHPNKAPDPRTQKHGQDHGYDLSKLRARQVQLDDFENFDLILAMDETNLADLKGLAKQLTDQNKTVKAQLALMSEHCDIYPKQAVPDPYYGEADGFKRVIEQCESAAKAWIKHLQTNLVSEDKKS